MALQRPALATWTQRVAAIVRPPAEQEKAQRERLGASEAHIPGPLRAATHRVKT